MLRVLGRFVEEFEIDLEQSYIDAVISVDNPLGSVWSVRIECGRVRIIPPDSETEDEKAERLHMEDFLSRDGCHADLCDISLMIPSWRDLEGQRREIAMEATFPHLPDDAGSFFYATEHEIPTKNRIAFGRRKGNVFNLSWKFVVGAYGGGTGVEVSVETALEFRKLYVRFPDDTPDMALANRIAAAFSRPGDFGAGEIETPGCVGFQIKDSIQ
jgi:hypothetical protein